MRCPDGHESVSTDYCDVCGIAMDADATAHGAAVGGVAGGTAGGAAPADVPAATTAATDCPSCGVANAPDALFCEACGYDFTTGQLPQPLTPPAGMPGTPDPGVVATPTATPTAPADGPSPAPALEGWVAEVWVDPDWYADQESTDPLPSPGLPLVVRLANTSVLIGRTSRSRGIHPDIDLTSDSGISRRHAQLTTDGSRWWVEDLGSSNGTYVGPATGPLPKDAIAPGAKQEVAADDRIYLGAWTRIILRRAAPGEL